jgi:hypothetical protein
LVETHDSRIYDRGIDGSRPSIRDTAALLSAKNCGAVGGRRRGVVTVADGVRAKEILRRAQDDGGFAAVTF